MARVSPDHSANVDSGENSAIVTYVKARRARQTPLSIFHLTRDEDARRNVRVSLMSASVQNLGTVLEPERVHVARTAYFAAIKYLGIDDAEFRHIWPPRLDARLARLVIRLAREEFDDPHAICACALAILKGARFTNADFELASA
jgi:hypothetical protein